MFDYITKDEYLNVFNMPEIEGDDVTDKDYALAINVASQEINWLSGNSIGDDVNAITQPYTSLTGTTYDASKRIEAVKNATALMAKTLADRGIEWLRGSASLSIGGNFSTSQSNPDEPDYIPPVILRRLEMVGYFTRQSFKALDTSDVFAKSQGFFGSNDYYSQGQWPIDSSGAQAIAEEVLKKEGINAIEADDTKITEAEGKYK